MNLITQKDTPGFIFIRNTGCLRMWGYKICGGLLKSMTLVMDANYVQRFVQQEA
jgi:hypothetical protein